eukprot:jgi/Chrzof1/3617/Cz13g02150.t1
MWGCSKYCHIKEPPPAAITVSGSHNPLNPDRVLNPCSFSKKLELVVALTLVVASSRLVKLPWKARAGLSQLTNLTSLSLLIQSPPFYMGNGGYHLPNGWQEQLHLEVQHLSVLTNLQSIQLKGVCGEKGQFSFSDNVVDVVICLTNLTHLDLGYITIKPNTLPTLCKLTQLETLTLCGDFELLSAQDFACLQPLSHLKRLELCHYGGLSKQPADLADLPAVAKALAGLQHLERLNFPVSPATASAVPLIKHVPGL